MSNPNSYFGQIFSKTIQDDCSIDPLEDSSRMPLKSRNEDHQKTGLQLICPEDKGSIIELTDRTEIMDEDVFFGN